MKNKAYSPHIGESLNCFCKVFNCLVCIAVLNAVTHTMLEMSLQNYLPCLVQCGMSTPHISALISVPAFPPAYQAAAYLLPRQLFIRLRYDLYSLSVKLHR